MWFKTMDKLYDYFELDNLKKDDYFEEWLLLMQ